MPDAENTIGTKIKELRYATGISIETIAQQTGISVADLTRIEEGQLSPPLGNLVSLAGIFEVPVGELIGASGDSPFCIVRVKDRTAVSRFGSIANKASGYHYQSLGHQKRNRQMEPFLVTLVPTKPLETKANEHIGEEFLFVLEGEVEVCLGDHRDTLVAGDSIYYDSKLPHIVRCASDHPATILAVIYAKEEMMIF